MSAEPAGTPCCRQGRWLWPGRLCWAALLPGLLLQGCASRPAPQTLELATPAGVQRLAFWRLGQGAGPTLVMQSGLGDSHEVWSELLPWVSARHPVFLYDRPGYGDSPRSPAPRDPCTIARELHALLQRSGQRPPYVLLGHSLGGLYQHAFARLYPQEVAGLLLLEPTHPEHWTHLQREVPVLAAGVRTLRGVAFTETMRQEFEAQTDCLPQLPPLAVPAPPAWLLGRSDWPLAERGAFAALVSRQWEDWRRLAAVQRIERLPGDEHYLQRSQPQAVASALERLLSTTPSSPPTQRTVPP